MTKLERSGEFSSGAGVILVGNKTDLARSRQVRSKVSTTEKVRHSQIDIILRQEGRNLALLYGLKFIETGAGIGHNIDQLLVGIVIQSR